VLHHDGTWRHEGQLLLNRKLRERFDRSVVYLPDEHAYVVKVGRFRGQIEVEEAGFFVRSVDLARGRVVLSDRQDDALDVASLRVSPIDGALLCTVKRDLEAGGLPARFTHAAQSELMNAVEERDGACGVVVAGEWAALPEL
jgi:hypothetical protein